MVCAAVGRGVRWRDWVRARFMALVTEWVARPKGTEVAMLELAALTSAALRLPKYRWLVGSSLAAFRYRSTA